MVEGAIKVACIGAGYFSKFHYEAWSRIDGVELVASVNRDITKAKATGLQAFDDIDVMLESVMPDLVDVITPPETHLNYIRKISRTSVRTIICQKPFCTNISEAKEAVANCAMAGTTLIIHENFRFQPWYREIKKAIDSGMLGEVHQLTFRLRTGDGQGPEAYLGRQPYFQKMPKFLIHETGVHWVDTFRYLFGKPTSVYADLRKINPTIMGEDAGYFIMEFESGERALFDANRHLDHAAENCRTTLGECLVEGTNGTLQLDGRGELTFRAFGSLDHAVLLPAKQWLGFAGDCVHALQSHVISELTGNQEFENSAEDYIEVLKIEEAIYHSAESGRKLSLAKSPASI